MSIKDSLLRVKENILNCEVSCGREENSVALMAVSKFHSIQEIQEVIDAGQLLFGENRVQETEEKFPSLYTQNPKIELHLIGALQRNKVKKAVRLVNCIQSVDRLELIQEIQKHAQIIDKKISILFELHTAEESKTGFLTEDALLQSVEFAATCSHIECKGFMTMAPFCSDERRIRASFQKVREVAQNIQSVHPHLPLTELSMGMSNDYKIAIEEGSTLVRIGTAIFGERI